MKAISIHPEFVQEIINGEKTEEVRSWNTSHDGDLLIVTTASNTHSGFAACIVDLYDVLYSDVEEEDEETGELLEYREYYWQFRSVRPVIPFSIRGKQGFYPVDDSKIVLLDSLPESERQKAWDDGIESCRRNRD